MKRTLSLVAWITVFLVFGTASEADAQSQKTILKKKGGRPEYVDSARYRASRNDYEFRRGGVVFSYPARDVEYVQPPRPADVNSSDPQKLVKVMEDYKRMWWDVVAFRKLFPIYVQNKQTDKALALFEDMQSTLGDDIPPDMQKQYWLALRLSGKNDQLTKELAKAIAGDNRDAAAAAYLVQGDSFVARNDHKGALVDGYLRVIVLYEDVEDCRQEALEKTIRSLDALGDARAERFRKILKRETAQSKE